MLHLVCEFRADIAYHNKAEIYGILFKAAGETLTTIAADPKHLGARIGFTAVLHSWGSAMTRAKRRAPRSPHSLHRARWRDLAGRLTVGLLPARLLPARARALTALPPPLPGEAGRRP